MDEFTLSNITEQMVFRMRNPSSLPGDVQGAQMNEREKYYLEEQKKECAIPENNRGMCFPNGVLMQNCYEK